MNKLVKIIGAAFIGIYVTNVIYNTSMARYYSSKARKLSYQLEKVPLKEFDESMKIHEEIDKYIEKSIEHFKTSINPRYYFIK